MLQINDINFNHFQHLKKKSNFFWDRFLVISYKIKMYEGNNQGIIAGEKLFAVEDPQILGVKPHCSIGAVSFYEDSGKSLKDGYASAVLISPNLLLTAGHACISPNYGT